MAIFFKGLSERAALACVVFNRYVQIRRDFWETTVNRLRSIADHQPESWQNAFRLQELLVARQALRFDYLFGAKKFKRSTCKSLDRISDRLEKDWSEHEEVALIAFEPSYRDICNEIKSIQAKWDSNALDEVIRALEQDFRYREARVTLSEEVRKLQSDLRR
jgi:hypothetical protein